MPGVVTSSPSPRSSPVQPATTVQAERTAQAAMEARASEAFQRTVGVVMGADRVGRASQRVEARRGVDTGFTAV